MDAGRSRNKTMRVRSCGFSGGLRAFACLFAVFAAWFPCVAQEPVQTHVKLLLSNEKDEVLLVQFQGLWEPLGERYRHTSSLLELLGSMAGKAGGSVSNHKLHALVTTYRDDGAKPVTFLYVGAQWNGGDAVTPPGCDAHQWVPAAELQDRIDLKEMALVAGEIPRRAGKPFIGALRVRGYGRSALVEVLEPFSEF